jgi:putative ABC transport system permease protein
MRRIATLSLLHDKGKLLAAVAGVAFAAVLVLTQTGLYMGFRQTSSTLLEHEGGDLWITGRGSPVVDNGEALSSGVKMLALAHPAVERVRAMIFSFAAARKSGGGIEFVELVGVEDGPGPIVPWTLEQGFPADIHGPSRMAIDRSDVKKLELPEDPVGSTLEVQGETLHVAAVTEGIHGFTLSPYVFTDAATARRCLGMGEDQATYWIVDLKDPSRADEVARDIERETELMVWKRADYATKTEDYWVKGSGAGTALALSAVLGVIVGFVIVGQTLYTLTKEHLKELATLKAIGATGGELARFVTVQAGILALLGGGAGVLLANGAKAAIAAAGLTVVLSPQVYALGLGTIVAICAFASMASVRTILNVEAARVFQ